MPQIWAGIDAGKGHHHCVVIDADGVKLYSARVANDEAALLELIAAVTDLAAGAECLWAIDLSSGGAALILGLLAAHSLPVVYIPGHAVHHAAKAYRGDGKTDAKDAAIIADQARMRRDLQLLSVADESRIELRALTAHRKDLVCDRTRAINRLRGHLLEYFPALERAFNYSASRASLLLLTGYATPDAIRKMGESRLARWLRAQGCRIAVAIAATAVAAAKSQQSVLPGQAIAAELARRLALDVIALESRIAEIDQLIAARVDSSRAAELLRSIPGFGPLLAAEFLASTGADLSVYVSADRLAGVAGLAPAPRDSGRISSNHHRPRRYDRRLLRACYLAAMVSVQQKTESRVFYDRKRGEGKSHKQAILALARRRLDVIWAMFRDDRIYTPSASYGANFEETETVQTAPQIPQTTTPAQPLLVA